MGALWLRRLLGRERGRMVDEWLRLMSDHSFNEHFFGLSPWQRGNPVVGTWRRRSEGKIHVVRVCHIPLLEEAQTSQVTGGGSLISSGIELPAVVHYYLDQLAADMPIPHLKMHGYDHSLPNSSAKMHESQNSSPCP